MKKCLLALLCFCSIQLFGQGTLESDRLALVAIYNATAAGGGGEYYNDLSDWVVPGAPGDNPCGWSGVTCTGGRVTRLDFSNAEMQGPIAPEIGNLSALTYLNVQGSGEEMSHLVGEIPLTLGNLTNLEYLNLSGNVFEWTNVAVIGNLINLKELIMDTRGNYPAAFGNLVNLESCTLGDYGPWRFSNTQFPEAIYQWTKIKHLKLGGLVFTTPITDQIGTLSNLETLELGALTGNLPAGIGNLSKLTRLAIEGHYMVGQPRTIPAEIGNLTNLTYLQFINSGLVGPIPSSLTNLTNLTELNLSGNNFSGSIPGFLGQIPSLRNLNLGQNEFSGVVPAELTNLPNLVNLSLLMNRLTGPLPNFSASPANLKINLVFNAFTYAGLEENLAKLDGYFWQSDVAMYTNGVKASQTSGPPAMLSVNVGGTPANNTYYWYKNGILQATNVGNPNFQANDEARYHVVITNKVLTKLNLQSVSYTITRLPVTLVSFDGFHENGRSKLEWKTTSETNNKGFEIQRSADARTFENIGFVDGNGDTEDDKTYHFTDLNPFAVTYYRLKQLDHDGKSEFSRVIALKSDAAVLKIFPNPAQDFLTISGMLTRQRISIVDPNGRTVLKREVSDKEPVSISRLPSGLYTVVIGSEVKKLLISR
ncbi:hypothetical protein GCM10010967_32850 [Dyadobacter beijingensis]|uniref:Secreted protein (Por secretion system target) n=1 Tax=Dyadobacter beijingensis TaxID=365489 RepID=A0ABQ2I133_9BACT|nr:T9SS type A sorting domain-containing protein [Dyadobacter beijingensis]GGM96582.1 hypothetical protein GCM10010967_32850 [Dyadobacter beijingensis]